jgi:hypothetical protein
MEAGLQLEDEAGEVRRGGVDGLLLLVDLARGEVAPLGALFLDGARRGRRAEAHEGVEEEADAWRCTVETAQP